MRCAPRPVWALFLLFSPSLAIGQQVGAEWFIKPVLTEVDKFFLPALGQKIFVAVKDGKAGVVDMDNRVVVPFKYKTVNIGSSGWIGANAPEGNAWYTADGKNMNELYEEVKTDWSGIGFVKKAGKWAIIESETGKLLSGFEYNAPQYEVYKGHILKKDNGEEWASGPTLQKWTPEQAALLEKTARSEWPGVRVFRRQSDVGFTSLKGDTLARPVYRLHAFHPKGYAVVSKEKNKWIVINQKNETVLDLPYESMSSLTENLFLPVKQNGKWGIIQLPEGKVVVPVNTYGNLYRLNGRAVPELFVAEKDGLKGVIDERGKILAPFAYSGIDNWSEKITLIYRDKKVGIWWTGVAPAFHEPKYKRITNTKDSICIAQCDSLWTLIDAKTGAEFFPCRYSGLERKGPYFIGSQKIDSATTLYTLLDRKGKELLPPDAVVYHVLPDGTLWVERKDGVSLHRTLAGKTLREYPSKNAWVDDGQYIAVRNPGERSWRHFLATDAPGKEEWLDALGKLEDGVRRIQKNGLWGYANAAGKIIIPAVFDEAQDSDQGYLKVKYKGKWGVLINPEAKK